MQVMKKGNKGCVNYRGVTFIDEDTVDVTDEWFDACKSPSIVEVKAKSKAKPSAKSKAKPRAKSKAKPRAKSKAKPRAKSKAKPRASTNVAD